MAPDDQLASAPALALETSSASGFVALGRDGIVLESCSLSGSRRHAAELLPSIARLCETHEIEPSAIGFVFVSAGPGSFTGLRIGITTARMLAMAVGAKIVAVPTLDVIAQNAMDAENPPDRVAVLLDAKRSRVYTGLFARGSDRYVAVTEPQEAEPGEFLAAYANTDGTLSVMGEGVAYHRPVVEATGLTILDESLNGPRAETVFRLGLESASRGMFADRRTLIPTYIRPPEAEEKWQQRHGAKQEGS